MNMTNKRELNISAEHLYDVREPQVLETDWNRKDRLPTETVEDIQNILKENGIATKVTSETQYNGLWYSNRIEFVGLNGKGTNGKGISREFAMASGYAEFMERLQTRMLFEGLFPNQDGMPIAKNLDEAMLCDLYLNVFGKYLKRNHLHSLPKVKELIYAKGGQYGALKKYYDYTEKKIVYLPERFLFSICGSNGLCSGNTKYEAFCQGLCEVFERYVNYKIYFGHEMSFPTVDRKIYEGLHSYAMIQAMETKGYQVYVKDCTLDGIFPVLGVLAINHNRTKYYFKLGSDMNMDICLQRCITEMFQGLDINSTFRLQLKELDDCAYDNFWKLRNTKEEYYKTVRTGEGRLPRSMFMDKETHNLEMRPFIEKGLSNKEVAEKLSGIVDKQGLHIYIKDYSYLGFQTMNIYVPGLSEIIDYDFGIAELQDVFELIRRKLRETRLDIVQLSVLLVRVVSENLISAEYTVAELLGLNLNQNYQGILKFNIYLFIAWLYVLLRRQEECEKWLYKYHVIMKMNKRDARIETAIFQALIVGVPKDVFVGYLESTITEKEKGIVMEKVNYYYQLQKEELCLDVCNDCGQCQLFSYCNYSVVAHLKSCLNEKYLKYEQEYDYSDEFYQ